MSDYKCPICSNNHISRSVQRDVGGVVVQCSICGHLSLFPLIDEKSIIAQYEKSAIVKQKNVGNAIFDNLAFKMLKKNDTRKHLSVLDVGCGVGEFLKLCKRENYDVTGIEVTKDIVDNLTKDGYEVYQSTLEAFSKTDRQFDWVACIDVIEHLKDPLSTIKSLTKLVKPNGRLVIQTPNGAAIEKFGNEAYGLKVDREHLHYYNPDQLTRILSSYGFYPVSKKFIPASSCKLNNTHVINNHNSLDNNQVPYRSTSYKTGTVRKLLEILPPGIRGSLRSAIQVFRLLKDIPNSVYGTSHEFIIVFKKS